MSPDGRFALSGDSVSGLTLWNLEHPAMVHKWKVADVYQSVNSVEFLHRDASTAVSCCGEGIYVWDVFQKQELLALAIGDEPIFPDRMAVAPDDSYLLSNGSRPGDRTYEVLRKWSLADGHLIDLFPDKQYSFNRLVIEPTGTTAFSIDGHGVAWIWNILEKQPSGHYDLGLRP
jgi:WD40 repeat protein